MPNLHCNILLIDEDEIDTMVTSQMLSDADSGFRVITCGCLRSAVEALHSGQEIDLVLMDLAMPDGTGQRAIEQIQSASGSLPIIVLSTWETPFLRKLHSPRVTCFLQKNGLTLDELRNSIESAVARRSPRATETGLCVSDTQLEKTISPSVQNEGSACEAACEQSVQSGIHDAVPHSHLKTLETAQ